MCEHCLTSLQDAGWLTWHAQSGRGKRGTLTFLVTPESVRSGMMEQVLHKGQHQNALELAQIAPEQLRQLLQPFLGGQWQNDTPTLRIPYYRPLEPLQPGFLPGRAEQHLAGPGFCRAYPIHLKQCGYRSPISLTTGRYLKMA